MDSRQTFCAQEAKRGGQYAKAAWATLKASFKHDDPRNVVTNIDREISALLTNNILRAYPDDAVYSEEASDIVGNTTTRLWSIDPIDGTANYIRGLPLYATTVSVLKGDKVESSAVYLPAFDELFVYDGTHAMESGRPLSVSSCKELHEAYVSFHPGRVPAHRTWALQTTEALLLRAKKTLNLGASAIDLVYLAAGKLDVVIYGTLTTLDVAGAILMVRAAGGEVYAYDTGLPVLFSSVPTRIIATATPELYIACRQAFTPE